MSAMTYMSTKVAAIAKTSRCSLAQLARGGAERTWKHFGIGLPFLHLPGSPPYFCNDPPKKNRAIIFGNMRLLLSAAL